MIRIVARMLAFTLLASTLLMGSEGEQQRSIRSIQPSRKVQRWRNNFSSSKINSISSKIRSSNSRIISRHLNSSSSRTTRKWSNRISNSKTPFRQLTKRQRQPRIHRTR